MKPPIDEEKNSYRVSKSRFVTMLVLSITISLMLVGVAMWLYNISGAAQVDLSRPGYRDVRGGVVNEDAIGKAFPSSGPINSSTLGDFRELFDKTSDQIRAYDSFGGDPLSDQALGIKE